MSCGCCVLQVLELLDSSPTEQSRELLLATSAIVNAFLTRCPALAESHLTRILLKPLMVLAGGGKGRGPLCLPGVCAVALSSLFCAGRCRVCPRGWSGPGGGDGCLLEEAVCGKRQTNMHFAF